MTTVTATPIPEVAGMRLEIAGAPAGPVTISRSDPNGTYPVRLLTGQEPIAGSMIVTDYEPALKGTVTYVVTDSAAAEVSTTASFTGLVTQPALVVPILPQYHISPLAVVDYSHGRQSNATIHHPISRTDSVVVFGPLRSREGTVTFFAASFADAVAIENVLAAGETVLLRTVDHDGMDTYLVVTSTNVSVLNAQDETVQWQVAVEFVKSGYPEGDLLGAAGWTFAGLIEQYSTSADVALAFTDFNALVVGP